MASADAAHQLLSAATRRNLHNGLGQAVYVEQWLSTEQVRQRASHAARRRQLSQEGIRWRWCPVNPTQLQQRMPGPDGRWQWVPAYPPPPTAAQ